jgi:hypothetical protein
MSQEKIRAFFRYVDKSDISGEKELILILVEYLVRTNEVITTNN